ncbi:Chaperone protein DnaJ [subsurface metagenome]
MSIEDDLAGMFKHFNLGGGGDVNSVLRTMVRNVQIGMLKQMRRQIDNQIKALSGTEVGIDPFEILGVRPNATKDEVKQAYKKKAWDAHPDRGGSNQEMMKVNAAFEAISRVRGWK